jgi:hypothetical protein
MLAARPAGALPDDIAQIPFDEITHRRPLGANDSVVSTSSKRETSRGTSRGAFFRRHAPGIPGFH